MHAINRNARTTPVVRAEIAPSRASSGVVAPRGAASNSTLVAAGDGTTLGLAGLPHRSRRRDA